MQKKSPGQGELVQEHSVCLISSDLSASSCSLTMTFRESECFLIFLDRCKLSISPNLPLIGPCQRGTDINYLLLPFLKGRKHKSSVVSATALCVLWLGTSAWLPFPAWGSETSCLILITSALWFGPWLFQLLMWLPTLTTCLVPRLTTGCTVLGFLAFFFFFPSPRPRLWPWCWLVELCPNLCFDLGDNFKKLFQA